MDINVEHLVVCSYLQRRYIKPVLIVPPAAALRSFFSFLILKKGKWKAGQASGGLLCKSRNHWCNMLCFCFPRQTYIGLEIKWKNVLSWPGWCICEWNHIFNKSIFIFVTHLKTGMHVPCLLNTFFYIFLQLPPLKGNFWIKTKNMYWLDQGYA